jgi:hypothetical protein
VDLADAPAAGARICSLPAAVGRLLGARAALLDCTALVEGYRHREGWRYNAVRARRAGAG